MGQVAHLLGDMSFPENSSESDSSALSTCWGHTLAQLHVFMITLAAHSDPAWWVSYYVHFSDGEAKQASGRLRYLFRVTQLVSGRARICTQRVWAWSPCSYPSHCLPLEKSWTGPQTETLTVDPSLLLL